MKKAALMFPAGPEFGWRLLEGISEYVAQHPGLDTLDLRHQFGQSQRLPVGPLPFDGAITWAGIDDHWVLELWERGVPVVNCSGEWLDRGVPTVKFDDQAMADEAVLHLAERRPSSLAFIDHETTRSPGLSRQLASFVHAAESIGIPTHHFELTGNDPFLDLERRQFADEPALSTFIADLPKPTGIWSSDYVAVMVCRMAAKLGLQIPAEVAVLGKRDTRVARLNTPAISSIPMPGKRVGYMAMARLHAMMNGVYVAEPQLLGVPPVVVRDTTARITQSDRDVRRAFEIIQEQAGSGLTVNELMDKLQISKKTLSTLFKTAYGVSPGEQIRQVRITRAKSLLAQSDLTVTRIAAMCGFENVRSFNLFVKRETGLPPTAHRGAATRQPAE